MSWSEQFLKEFDPEMAATRRMLERIPATGLDWKPHAKSRSLGELATHVMELPRWGVRLGGDAFAVGSEKASAMKSAPDFLQRFDENVREARKAISAMSETDLDGEFTVTRGGQVFFALQRRSLLRRVLLSHLIHHRGQLSVYLRIQGVALPPIYGPTADEPM